MYFFRLIYKFLRRVFKLFPMELISLYNLHPVFVSVLGYVVKSILALDYYIFSISLFIVK